MARESGVKLTQKVVSSALPRAARYDLWDRDLSGFGLRVEVSGSKSFMIRYRADGGGRTAARRFMTVGRYGTLTVDEARRRAKALLGSRLVQSQKAMAAARLTAERKFLASLS